MEKEKRRRFIECLFKAIEQKYGDNSKKKETHT